MWGRKKAKPENPVTPSPKRKDDATHRFPIGPVDPRGWKILNLKPGREPNFWHFTLGHDSTPDTHYVFKKSYSDVTFLTRSVYFYYVESYTDMSPIKKNEVPADSLSEAIEFITNDILCLEIFSALEKRRRDFIESHRKRVEDKARFEAIKAANPSPVTINLGEQ